MKRGISSAAIALAALLVVAPIAQGQEAGPGWTAASHLWPSTVNGSGLSAGGTLDSLRFSVHAPDGRSGPWAVFTDVLYLGFDPESSRIRSIDFVNIGPNPVRAPFDTGSDTTLRSLAWTLSTGRTLLDASIGNLDVYGGVRYLKIGETRVNGTTGAMTAPMGLRWPPNSVRSAGDTRLWDAIVGVRGRVRLGSSNWSVPYYADVGAGSSRLTWQGVIAFSYAFQWGDLALAYRHLVYDQEKDPLLSDFRFSGPALGATFRF